MKIGLLSDTHGNVGDVKKAADIMIKEHNVDILIFLGDECEDIECVMKMFNDVLLVPGVFCEHYKNKNIPNRMIREFCGYKVLITHTPESHKNDSLYDLKPEVLIAQKKINMIFHGHTHIPNIEKKEDVIWINPGHLKKNDNRGYPMSFGIVDFDNKHIEIIELTNGNIIAQYDF